MTKLFKSKRQASLCLTTVIGSTIFSSLSLFSSLRSEQATTTSQGSHDTASSLYLPIHRKTSSLSPADNFEGVYARAFDPWPEGRPLPCLEPNPVDDQYGSILPTKDGILFLKPYKTGSSTSSGVNLRISRALAWRQNRPYEFCKARFDHGPWVDSPAAAMYGNRNRDSSILWTIVREPTKRAVSLFFHFQVSRMGVEPTDNNFRRFLTEQNPSKKYNYYLHNLSLKPFNATIDDPAQVANDILASYDFIGVTERMDESYVALAMLLRLPLSDVLYLSAKTSGGYDDAGQDGKCAFIRPSFVTEGMQAFFDGDDWQAKVKYDLAFYRAVNRSLDATIDRLGRRTFEKNLARLREAQKVARDRCLSSTVFPCDADGNFVPPDKTDCVFTDYGCAFECLDRVAYDLGLW
jgi:Galactose-3-O-sulfotransferase